jgi:PAS domain S-box-containing protein
MSEPKPDSLLFRTLFEATQSASIAVLADAPQFTIVAATHAFTRMVGATGEQLTGKPLLDTVPFCTIDPFEQQSLRKALDQPPTDTDSDLPNLTVRISSRRWTVATLPILETDGHPAMLLLTLDQASPAQQDGIHALSARPPKVESIDSYADRIATNTYDGSFQLPSQEVFETAVPGFAVFDLKGNVIDCNPAFAKTVGRSREELQTLNSASLVHPEDRDRSVQQVKRLVAGEIASFVIEKRYVRPDGNVVWVRNSVSLIRATAGRPPQLVTISEDLTLLRMAERALVKNEKLAAVGRLSASIVHELNNPLEAVTNLLFLITYTSELDEIRHYARLAEQELARVTQIATQTLRFYRHEAAPAPLQMADILDSVLALFEGRLRRRHVNIIRRYLPTSDPLRAYSGEIRQVFVNLISNALDAMGDTGELRIDVRPSRSWERPEISGVRVTISDTGSGIPREMLKRIFEPFVSTKESNGTGLGLWISKEIVRRHGGSLRVRSNTSGKHQGTAMSVFLPRDIIAVAA